MRLPVAYFRIVSLFRTVSTKAMKEGMAANIYLEVATRDGIICEDGSPACYTRDEQIICTQGREEILIAQLFDD